MPSDPAHPALEALQSRLREEEAAYAEVLAALDRLADFPLPAEVAPEVRERLERLNTLWAVPERPSAGGGLGGAVRQRAWDALAPALERQSEFNAALVQLLNAHLAPVEHLHAHLRELAGALVRYAQRLQPLADAGDRVSSALATTRSELVLESFDRRLESLGRRLEGLLAVRHRLDTLGEELRALRGALDAPPPLKVARAAGRAAADSAHTALESHIHDRPGDPGQRLRDYAAQFQERAPVVDLGCGGGELLEVLREAGIESRGIEANANTDPLDYLQGQAEASLGGVFASGLVERIPPAALAALLSQAHRTLREDGLLLLETVNPRSVMGLEAFHRDLAGGRPLHPDTLSFLAAAAGFTDVRVELRSPVPPDARLQPVPTEGLPERAARALNENVERLNGLVYGPTDYVLLARR